MPYFTHLLQTIEPHSCDLVKRHYQWVITARSRRRGNSQFAEVKAPRHQSGNACSSCTMDVRSPHCYTSCQSRTRIHHLLSSLTIRTVLDHSLLPSQPLIWCSHVRPAVVFLGKFWQCIYIVTYNEIHSFLLTEKNLRQRQIER